MSRHLFNEHACSLHWKPAFVPLASNTDFGHRQWERRLPASFWRRHKGAYTRAARALLVGTHTLKNTLEEHEASIKLWKCAEWRRQQFPFHFLNHPWLHLDHCRLKYSIVEWRLEGFTLPRRREPRLSLTVIHFRLEQQKLKLKEDVSDCHEI